MDRNLSHPDPNPDPDPHPNPRPCDLSRAAKVACVKSRDMHWALVAHRDQRDVNLSSLRLLLVADGSNPCKTPEPPPSAAPPRQVLTACLCVSLSPVDLQGPSPPATPSSTSSSPKA